MRRLLAYPRRLAIGLAAGAIALSLLAWLIDSEPVHYLTIVAAVIAMGLVNQQAVSVASRRTVQRLAGLERTCIELERRVTDMSEWIQDDTRPLPPEHVEQLLTTVRASMARIEVAQEQLVADVEARVTGRASSTDEGSSDQSRPGDVL